MARREALSPAEIERVVAELRALVGECGGNQSEAARRSKLKQQNINKYMNRKGSPGYDFARQLAAVRGYPNTDAMLRGEKGGEPVGPRLDTLPGWEEAKREALLLSPGMAQAIERVGGVYAPDKIPAITATSILELAFWWAKITSIR